MFSTAILAACLTLGADEWPQFQGPRGENRSADVGLLQTWPEGGPPLAWRAAGLGEGYSSVVIGGGRIFTAGNIAGNTVLTALDLTGKQIWQAKNGRGYDRSFPGSRGTPTLDGDRVYHLNGDGDVGCFDRASGKMLWTVNMIKQFDGVIPQWGLAESVLIDGDRAIVCPGGKEIAMVALDKRTGKTVWTCRGAGDPPGYDTATLVDYAGLRQIVTMTGKSVIGVGAESGKLLWRYEREAPYNVNVSTPIYRDGHIAIFTTWGRGATLLKLNVAGNSCSVEKVWHNPKMDPEHGGLVLLGDHVFGHADGNHKKRQWACMEWKTGELTFLDDGLPGHSGATTYADGRLYLLGERGEAALQVPNPKEFQLAGRFKLPKESDGPYWARPVVCGGFFFVRHGPSLYAYDVRKK